MNKIWYIEIDGKLEGPYSVRDLKCDIRVSPDTLAWKKGFAKAVPIRNIPELKTLFQDEAPIEESPGEKRSFPDFAALKGDQEVALDMRMEPFKWWILILLVLAILFFSYVLS